MHIESAFLLVCGAYEAPATTRAAWLRALERSIVDVDPCWRAAARIYEPGHFPRLRAWLVDDLATGAGLDTPLKSTVVLHGGRTGGATSIAGKTLRSPFLRVASPVPGLRVPLTLVVQVEHDASDLRFSLDPEHPLAEAMPAIARAFTHAVGTLEQHRASLLDMLHDAQDHLERALTALGGRASCVILQNVRPPETVSGAPLRTPLTDGLLEPERLIDLVLEHVPAETPLVVTGTAEQHREQAELIASRV